MDDTDDIQSLITRVAAGDRPAADELMRAIEPYILRNARLALSRDNFLSRYIDEDDIASYVMFELYDSISLGNFKGNSIDQLKSYLLKSIGHVVIDHARHYSRKKRDGVRLVSDFNDIDMACDYLDETSCYNLDDLISILPDKQRQVIELGFLHGLDQTEIAQALGVSRMTVSRWRESGLSALRKQLVLD